MKTRTIYINEDIIERGALKKAIIPKELPEKYEELSREGKFPFGDNMAFPEIYDDKFILKVLKKRYENCKNDVLSIGDIEDSDIDNITSAASKLIMKAKKMERGNEEKLEKMCLNYAIEKFRIPDDFIDFNINITDNIDDGESILQLDPEDSSIEYTDLKGAEDFNKEVKKRIVINMLIAGAAEYYSSNISDFAKDLFDINSDLPSLYKKIGILNRFILISDIDTKITEDDKKEIGVVNTKLGNDLYKTMIISKGLIFPVVVYETFKGLMELFASHGLPQDKNSALSILGKTDFVKGEAWYMRTGRILWDKFMESMNEVEDYKIPYIFMELCKLSTFKFNRILKEVFAGTRKGKKLMKELCENIEYSMFLDTMKKVNTEKNIIEDEYIHPDEL